MDKLEIKQGYFIQQTQYFIPVEIDLSVVPSSNNKTLNARLLAEGYNGMPLHVMEQPPRFFALAYRVSDACIYQ